jgi:hypothetical protein
MEAMWDMDRATVREVIHEQRQATRKKPGRKRGTSSLPSRLSKFLRTPERTETGWKCFGDMTVDDLLFAAREREKMASRNTANGYWLERTAKKLADAGVAKIEDLPDDVIQEILDDAPEPDGA